MWCWGRLEEIKKIVREMKYCKESRRTEIFYKEYKEGRLTRFAISYAGTVF